MACGRWGGELVRHENRCNLDCSEVDIIIGDTSLMPGIFIRGTEAVGISSLFSGLGRYGNNNIIELNNIQFDQEERRRT